MHVDLTPNYYGYGNLSVGSRGSEVEALQRTLKSRGFDPGGIDGIFGPNTRAAVQKFQVSAGLEATGAVDAATTLALNGGSTHPGSTSPGSVASSGSNTTAILFAVGLVAAGLYLFR